MHECWRPRRVGADDDGVAGDQRIAVEENAGQNQG
jgi:hypothetical protein